MAVIASHPIHYQAPLFRALAAEPGVDVEVFFAWDFGVGEARVDVGFGVPIVWDLPLLEGYRHRFLSNWSLSPGASRSFDQINPGVVTAIMRGDFDVVWVHGYHYVTCWLALAAARAAKIPVVFRGETILPSARQGATRTVKDRVVRAFLQRSDGLMYIGSKSREFYEFHGVPPDRLFFTPYCVDNAHFQEGAKRWRPARDTTLAEVDLDPDLPVVLYASKLSARKRPRDAVEAIGPLGGRVQLAIVGDGSERVELERLVRSNGWNHIRFLGFKNQGEISKWYAASDIFVLPSSFEPWGLVVNEAMCFGLPIVTTNAVASAVDLVEHGVNGFVNDPGDVPALRAAVESLAADPGLRRSAGTRSLSRISQWDPDTCSRGVLQAIRSVATGA